MLFEMLIADTSEPEVDKERPDPKSFLNKDEYTLMVLEPGVYRQLYNQYMFTQLSEEERERQNRVMQSAELKQQAFVAALQLEERIKYYCTNISKKPIHESYCYNEFKTILSHTQKPFGETKKVTQATVWNSMDFLILFGYLTLVEETATLTKERKQYRLFVKSEDRLKFLQQSLANRREILELKQQEVDAMQARVDELKSEIEASKAQADEKCDCEVCKDQEAHAGEYEEHDRLMEEQNEHPEDDRLMGVTRKQQSTNNEQSISPEATLNGFQAGADDLVGD